MPALHLVDDAREDLLELPLHRDHVVAHVEDHLGARQVHLELLGEKRDEPHALDAVGRDHDTSSSVRFKSISPRARAAR
jgi:hypothetical protein